MDISILEDLGFTPAEIKIYLALLELGNSTAGQILDKTGLQNSVVHRTLHRLIEKGFVTFVLEGKRRYYQASSPKSLMNLLEDRKKRLEEILPQLIAKQQVAKKKPEAVIYRGKRGIKEMLNHLMETNAKKYFAYGGPQKANELLSNAFWKRFHNKRIKKRISAQIIFHSSLRKWGISLNKKALTTVRFTGKEFEELTETVICGNSVGIIIYTDKPYGFLIEEETVANSYMKFFELLWKETMR